MLSMIATCPSCNGTGRSGLHPCANCGGTGKILLPELYMIVKILTEEKDE
jgi:DnaJ-class molecular chaperone